MDCGWLSRYFFFFQAEDGIRDVAVTGVQTCALPILCSKRVVRVSGCWLLRCGRSDGEPEAHGLNHLEQRLGTGRPFARQAFVEAFPRKSGVASELSHAARACDVAQRRSQFGRIVVFQRLAQVLHDFLFGAEVVGHVEWPHLDVAHSLISLAIALAAAMSCAWLE